MLKTMSALSLLFLATVSGSSRPPRLAAAPLEARLWLESHPGKEVVLKLAAESEDELLVLRVMGPDGRELAHVDARGADSSGLSSLELEFRELELPALLATYAPGTYVLTAATVDGALSTAMARFDPELPPATRILQPLDGELVSPANVTVRWTPQPEASAYEVRIDQGDNEGIVIKLPPLQNALQVPDGWLAHGMDTVVEVAVIGANGNQTLAEVQFTTLER